MEADKVEPKFRKQLNQGQIAVLLLLYRFRFGTRELLAASLGIHNGTALYSRLKILVDQGYVGSNYDQSYKLAGRPASYYLLPKALRALKQVTDQKSIGDTTIKGGYRVTSEQFTNHSLAVYAIANKLQTLYPTIKLYTKRELSIYDYFPKQLPDLFVSLKVGNDTKRCLLELVEISKQTFVVDRWIRMLINHWQDGAWQARGGAYPAILCVCENGSLENRLQKQVTRELYRSGDTDMLFYTTTQVALLSSSQGDDAIWSNTAEPDKLYSLETLPVNS